MLTVRVAKVPAGFPIPNTIRSKWTVIYFEAVDGRTTRIREVSMGIGTDEESQNMRRFFEQGNVSTLLALQKRLQHHHGERKLVVARCAARFCTVHSRTRDRRARPGRRQNRSSRLIFTTNTRFFSPRTSAGVLSCSSLLSRSSVYTRKSSLPGAYSHRRAWDVVARLPRTATTARRSRG